MATQRNNDDRSQARREAAALLGVDIDRLSPADGLRVDMVSALRLVIDAEQGAVLSGNQADLGKLNVAVQSLIALLPGRALPEPEQPDTTEEQIAPLRRLFRHLHEENARLTAENSQLRAALGGAPALPDVSQMRQAIDPAEADVVPPGEWRGETYAGVKPGPDDPKPPVTIQGKAVRPKPPAARAAPPPRPAWEDWLDAGAGVGPGYDRWADNR